MRKLLSFVFIFAAITLSPAQPTNTPDDTATDSVPTFRSRAELVYVPVIVKDKKGGHLGGLKQEAFTVEQDGKPVRAAIFEEVKNASGEMTPQRELPGVISNYSAADQRPRRLLIIVLDTLNTPALYQVRAKQALLNFLMTAVPPNEPVALLGLGQDGLRQLHPFTTDTSLLIAAIKKVQTQVSNADDIATSMPDATSPADRHESQRLGGGARELQDFLDAAESNSGYNAFRQRQSIRLSLLCFQQLANAFAAIPGRKTVVWATGGFPFLLDDPAAFNRMGMEFAQDYDRTWRVLSSANISVYPVDLMGLVAPDFNRYSAANQAGQIYPMYPGYAMGRRPAYYDYDRQRQDTMRAVANATGGIACVDNNDLARCLDRAARDSESYYLLGYYLQGDQKPGWHKLKVKVAGEHGEVRARQGFYSGDTPRRLEQRRHDDMYVAVASPIDYTGVHFAITQPRLARTPDGKTTISVDVIVPGASFRIATQQQNQLDLDVLALALRSGGKVAGTSSHKISGTPSDASANRLEKEGLRITETMSVEPGKYVLRVAVRDNQTGQIGTVHTPIETK